ncbi:hypothetical protein [Pseudarthrobacter cellobiosi]|uniref:hypothetical protein n=1 Tax=Pseudarthrobacter cellobiosi TaxID=2953654 RepID=UPI00208F6A77|nr:hypothetical protein [Pseudarthrobacter sp. HLT1-5]MCO4256512.1 hypothetical protein [Pseudarthrobacter sp. HLT1-5]
MTTEAPEAAEPSTKKPAAPRTRKPAPAKSAAPKPAPEPGPKPRSIIVENTLKCQTNVDGEISLSLLVPYKKMKVLLKVEDAGIPEEEIVDYILEQIMAPEDAETLTGLQDGADTLLFAMEWMQAVGEKLGDSVGKSGPSSS